MPEIQYESEYLARLLVRTDRRIAEVRQPDLRAVLIESREAIASARYRLTRDELAMSAGVRALHIERVA